jgi:hypothetical protein
MEKVRLAIAIAALASCTRAADPPPSPLQELPVNAALNITPQKALGWGYRREIRTDLTGDGSEERVVLAAGVEIDDRGVPLWEDGHQWAVIVQERGADTLLYAAFVPNGFVEAAVLTPDTEGRRELLIQERTPTQVRALVVSYQKAGEGRSVSAAHYQIDQWLPGSARLME